MAGPGKPENLKPATKGEVRNPNGRPVGSRNRATVLRELLALRIDLTLPNGKTRKGSLEEAAGMGLIKKAMKGDAAAFREIMDSVYGRVAASSDIPPAPEERHTINLDGQIITL